MKQNFDFAAFDAALPGHYGEMEADLLRLLAIPSLDAPAEGEGAPFGRPIADCLEAALDICARLGLETTNVDGYCGFAHWPGETEKQVGILGHLDVVPAVAEEWCSPPFSPQVIDGCIYGRGALDDKGPMIAALHAAMTLRELGYVPHRSLRFIFGCNEESGMACMRHFLTRYPQPEFGFTPDGSFPLIIGEKGIYHYELAAAWPRQSQGLRLTEIQAGLASNVIPSTAQARLSGGSLESGEPDIRVEREGDAILVTALGTAGHASTPDQGADNALSKLIAWLAQQDLAPGGSWDFIAKLARLTADDKYGAGFGVAGEDELSRVTHVPTMLRLDEGGAVLTCDLRFLLTKKSDHYTALLHALADREGLVFTAGVHQDPLYLGEDHPLIPALLQSYREVTNDHTQPLIIGGGTYAKTMKNFLAFGPEPPLGPGLAHQADEHITREHLLNCARIYGRAIWRLAEME